MKTTCFAVIIGCLLSVQSFSQTYWVEDFGTGSSCNIAQVATAYSGTNGSWTISQTGTNGAFANEWYISAVSSNNGAGSCEVSCPNSNNQTLHVANVPGSPGAALFCPTGDCGAAYDDVDNTAATSKRIESPTINLTGISSAQMSFIYIMKGQSGFDFVRVWFFDGVNWVADTIPPQTSGCSFYSTWTYMVVNLPSFADNNPDFKVGFEWQNNGDGIATDPSLSIDNITIAQSFASVSENPEEPPFTYTISENYVNFSFADNSEHKLELYDLTGKLLAGTHLSAIRLENDGIYLINVIVNGERYSVKVSNH